MSDPLDRLVQALADRYDVQRRIGSGGMALVYLAEDRRHQRPVAIKVLHPKLAATIGPDRFLREIRIAAQLQHPHILTLIDSGEAGGFIYYVMPYVEGESLRERLETEGELPVDDVLRVIHDVADALAHAHRRGVVHRDIKPDNILLTGRQAQVMDFGVAKAVSEATEQTGITSAGLAVGTPAYMAPEQAAGDPNVDHRADIYALGVVAYELLTGKPPFERDTPQELIAAHVTQEPEPIDEVRSTVPPPVARIVMRCLAKRAADRFQSAEELVRELEVAGSSGDFVPLQRSAGRRAMPKNAAWAGAGVVGVALLVVAAQLVLRSGGTAPTPGPDPSRIAVLYFDDHSPDQDLGYLAAGLTEALIHELSQVEALDVISRNGVRPFRESDVTLDSIVRTLDVGTLVEGSVARSEGRVRVTVQLIDAATGAHLESRTLERPWQELFALQDTVSLEVSRFLLERLGQEIQLRERRAETGSVEAWELVQRAERRRHEADALADAGDTAAARQTLATADSMLRRAADLDEDWILPLLARGWVAADRAAIPGVLRFSYDNRWNRTALELANEVLDRQQGHPAALELRGVLEWRLAQDPNAANVDELTEAAERDLRAAVTADPRRAVAWGALSDLLRQDTRFAEAKHAAESALEADQFLEEASQIVFRLYETTLELKQLDEAEHWCDEGWRRFSSAVFVNCALFLAALPGGPRDSPDEAWRALDRIVELSSPQSMEVNHAIGLAWVSAVLARDGLDDSARTALTRAHEMATEGLQPYIGYYGANTLLQLGDREGALELLGGYLEAVPGRKAYVASDWMFEELWDDPRFAALVDTTER